MAEQERSFRQQGGPRGEPVELTDVAPVRAARLSDEVAERIRRYIVREEVPEGARLPSERELADLFGASRPTVSQALRTLALMGLVEVRRGSGAYVLRRPETMVAASVDLMLDLDAASLDHLMELRLFLETFGVQKGAARAGAISAGERSEIDAVLERLQAATGKPAEWIAADTIFHATLVRSCGNPYVGSIYESVHTAIVTYELNTWVRREELPAWLRVENLAEQMVLHAPIANAVLRGDPVAAGRAVLHHHELMLEHLRAARRSASRRARSAAPLHGESRRR